MKGDWTPDTLEGWLLGVREEDYDTLEVLTDQADVEMLRVITYR